MAHLKGLSPSRETVPLIFNVKKIADRLHNEAAGDELIQT
jgi:hypothetical protein